MADEKSKIRLEFKEENGRFHFENLDNVINEPNTYGWVTIAETNDREALRFIYILKASISEAGIGDSHKFTTDEIRLCWYVLSNSRIGLQSLVDKAKELDPENFE